MHVFAGSNWLRKQMKSWQQQNVMHVVWFANNEIYMTGWLHSIEFTNFAIFFIFLMLVYFPADVGDSTETFSGMHFQWIYEPHHDSAKVHCWNKSFAQFVAVAAAVQ